VLEATGAVIPVPDEATYFKLPGAVYRTGTPDAAVLHVCCASSMRNK
jgi:hypothetical protein